MTTQPNEEPEEKVESPAMPSWIRVAAIAALSAGLIAYLAIAVWGDEAKWGPRGDAVGPFAALFNAGALFAALWAVHLQRTELALQRQEQRAARLEMVEQRKQFERTAKAQEDLAASQARLAVSQETANTFALLANLTQHEATVINIAIAEAQIRSDVADLYSRSPNMGDAFMQQIKPFLDSLGNRRERQQEALDALKARLGGDA